MAELNLFSPPPAGGAAARQVLQSGNGGRTARPLKRAAPRFLGDDAVDDSDDGGRAEDALARMAERASKAKTTQVDVDRLFAEADKDDDALPPPLTQFKLIDDDIAGAGRKTGEGGDQEGDKPKRQMKKRALMNAERLLGDRGLRKLRANLLNFKIKGKGHEEEDLRRLMTVYQLWAHQMWPKGTFRDTVQTVEKLCHSRLVNAEMKVFRDEANGIFRPLENPTSEADNNEDGPTVSAYPGSAAASSRAGSPEEGSQGRPKKSYFDDIPTSSPGGALSRDAEMGAADSDDDVPSARQHTPLDDLFGDVDTRRATTSEAGFQDADLEFDFEDADPNDDEAMAALAELEEAEAAPARKAVTTAAPVVLDDFDFGDEEDILREMEQAAQKEESRMQSKRGVTSFYAQATAKKPAEPKAATTHVSSKVTAPADFEDFDFGDDEAILREMEAAEQADISSKSISKTPSLEMDLGDDFEEDEEFLKSVEDQAPVSATLSQVDKPAMLNLDQPLFEEDEDLYS